MALGLGLVRQQQHTIGGAAQHAGDPLVQRGAAFPHVDDEQDRRGGLDGGGDLRLDVLLQALLVDDPHAARVDELHGAVGDRAEHAHTIARDPGRRLDDGHARARQRVSSVDFPTFGRPTIATIGGRGVGAWSSAVTRKA